MENRQLLLYKSYIRPVMTSASPAWGYFSKANMQRLQAAQNKAFRIIGGHGWYKIIDKMHSDTQIPRLKAYIRVLGLKLYASAKSSRKIYIKNVRSDCQVGGRRVPIPSESCYKSRARSSAPLKNSYPISQN